MNMSYDVYQKVVSDKNKNSIYHQEGTEDIRLLIDWAIEELV